MMRGRDGSKAALARPAAQRCVTRRARAVLAIAFCHGDSQRRAWDRPLCAYALDQRTLLGSLFPQAVIHGRDLDRPIEARGCKTQQGHAVGTTGHRQAQFAFRANGGKIGPEAR